MSTTDENLENAAEINHGREYSTENDTCMPSSAKESTIELQNSQFRSFESEEAPEDDAIEQTRERIRAFSSNIMTERSGLNRSSSEENASMTIRCDKHFGEVIKLYCERHDVVCCCICHAKHHSQCRESDIKYIPDVASGIGETDHTEKVLQCMSLISDAASDYQKRRIDELVLLDEDKNVIMQDIRQFTQTIVKKIEELEKASIEEVVKRHKALSRKISNDIAFLDDMIQKVMQERRIIAEHTGNSADLFILLNTGKNNNDENLKKLTDVQAHAERVGLCYSLCYSIESFFRDLEKLGELLEPVDVDETKFYNVKVSEDQNPCQITDITILQDDTFAITDYGNGKIKRLGQDFSVKQTVCITGGPCGITTTGESEVLVSLTLDKKLQFLSFGWFKTSLGDCINVNKYCRGVTYSGYTNKIYVACGGGDLLNEGPGEVRVYDRKGTFLKVYDTDQSRKPLFKHPVHMAISKSGSELFITDSKNGLIVIDNKGDKLYEVSVPFTKETSGICELDGDERLIITCKVSGNIVELVKQKNGVFRMMSEVSVTAGNPVSLAYLKSANSVVIISEKTDQICVKKLKPYN
ncbi:uncharacterized protein LOC123529166 [Mercenaria mercenaria]|uniref:uncharacterized protein LOC123529166 n=1 Tax=Mercenaria mercenaria TaxID=6596 RepID=UPI00234F4E82|nr:uncharacterized protein LOC123529166 [Mercenaria mercenaria]